MKRYVMHIGGEEVPPESDEWFETFNPFTDSAWALIPRGNQKDAEKAVSVASNAFTKGDWPTLTPTQRGALLRRVGDLIAKNAKELAYIEVSDNGKLISEVEAQIGNLPQWFYYYAGLADKIQGAVIPTNKPQTFNFTRYEPLGVCVAITPWNSPLLLTTMKIAPALAAGNTVIIKPSEHASASTLEIVQLFKEAGFPPGVINVVTGFGPEIGEALVTDPRVAKVAFTGSDVGGQNVYAKAAASLKHVTLELGGKSPQIVFEDAHLENAAKGVISGIFAATGQTCVAGSRLLVHETIHDHLIEQIVHLARQAKMGDPQHHETQVGPISTKPQFEKVLSYLDSAQKEGANCVLGGKKADKPECGRGWFVEPSIYTNVSNTMTIAREEIFGPVLSVIKFSDEEEALAQANDSAYGLAAGLWTADMQRVFDISARLQAGTVWVNTYRAFSYLSPFGGYKRSGIGRENGQEAIYEYLQTKSIWISTQKEVPNPFVMKI